jgi:hypothetical protein
VRAAFLTIVLVLIVTAAPSAAAADESHAENAQTASAARSSATAAQSGDTAARRSADADRTYEGRPARGPGSGEPGASAAIDSAASADEPLLQDLSIAAVLMIGIAGLFWVRRHAAEL